MENIAPALLDWFYKNRRILPFREDPTPYHVWLSEVMLQQTRVSAVLPYYERFLAALPDIPALAACDEEKLHKLWEGLGYYSRVRNLKKAAQVIQERYNGQFPREYDAVLALPTTLPISPMSPYYSKSLATNYDYDEMRFIDAASKFRVPTNDKGVPRTLQLLVNSDDSARLRCARNIAATLTELGLACETVESPTSVYEARLQAANYDIYLGITKLPTTADLSEFYRPWGEMSWGGLANETIYNMVNQSLADRGNYYNLHKLVADDGRIIPVMAGYYAIYAKRGVLSDLNPARDNVFYYTLGKTMESSKVATQFS